LKTHSKQLIEENLYKELRSYFKNLYYENLGISDWERICEPKVSGVTGEILASKLERHLTIKKQRILDIGCGVREFLISASKRGATVFGIDVDKQAIQLSKFRLIVNNIDANLCIAVGESLPFRDHAFDIVTSFYVLEHVNDPARVIYEALRVLKNGGIFYMCTPNSLFPYETHYKLFYFPLLPKKLAKYYLRIRRRKPLLIQEINYITLPYILRILKRSPFHIEIRNIIEEEIRYKLNNIKLIKSRKRKSVARLVRLIRIPPYFLSLFAKEIVIIVKKQNSFSSA